MRLKRLVFSAFVGAALLAAPIAAPGQDRTQTLADIRQELTVLYVELQRLGVELNTTGGAGGVATAGTTLDRVNALEAEVTKLTNKIEELENRISQVVRDGTNRIGDLEFRLCELEDGCDISSLGETPTLGGGELPVVAAPIPPATPDDPGAVAPGGELAVAEQADFDAAKTTLESGDAATAAQLLAQFVDAYPGGPLTADAMYLQGEALAQQNQVAEAARAFLASYSAAPTGTYAADALLKLGAALGQLGQVNEACVTLGEVANRFPTSPAVTDAQAARQALGCP
ncbi:MAG: tol-pal system protein YbgF [Maritimibacter sp.]|nr:tol-pal system protein YbgF [Maritimibacter sp.]